MQGSDGYLYGTTFGGGTNRATGGYDTSGTVFRISTNGTLTSLYSFGSVQDTNTVFQLDGANPAAALLQGSDGFLYGTTFNFGTNGGYRAFGNGTVFKISTNGVLTTLYSFGSAEDTNGVPFDGAGPLGLVQGSDGDFYGTTCSGGTNNAGTVFKITPDGALTTLHSFTGGDDGAWPGAGLVQGNDGCFYGTTIRNDHHPSIEGGGDFGAGTIFKISTNGAYNVLSSFTGDGEYLNAPLVQGTDRYLYGTTSGGGTYGLGTVFEISTNGALASLYSFSGYDGVSPTAAVLQAADGCLCGTTSGGGTNWLGTMFRMSTDGTLTSLYSFSGYDGANPAAALVQGSDGYFYGSTQFGGATNYNPNSGHYGYGTLFRIGFSGALTTLYSFTGTDGDWPTAALVQGSDGCFYGTTQFGGASNGGTVFKITTSGALASLYSFTGDHDSAYPSGLAEGSDGDFYGTTGRGGMGLGTVFRITANGVLTSLYSFSNYFDDGAGPQGQLEGGSGQFYGTTGGGGTGQAGTFFRLTILPEPPRLTITPSGANVIVAWQTNAAGFTLQSSTNLGSLALWATNPRLPVILNGQNVVTIPITGSQQFFRLSA